MLSRQEQAYIYLLHLVIMRLYIYVRSDHYYSLTAVCGCVKYQYIAFCPSFHRHGRLRAQLRTRDRFLKRRRRNPAPETTQKVLSSTTRLENEQGHEYAHLCASSICHRSSGCTSLMCVG